MKNTYQTLFTNPLLQIQAKSASLRELSNAEQKRIDKLIKLHKDIIAGIHIQNRTLQNNLTKEQYEDIAISWEQEKQSRTDRFGQKPIEISNYESLLHKADFAYNRGDSYSRRGHKQSAKQFINKSDTLYEKALEYLGEQITLNPSLQSWLDRDYDAMAHASQSSLPRARTSRGTNNQSRIGNSSIRDFKAYAVERAIYELAFEQTGVNNKPSKLKQLLSKFEDE